MRWRRTNYKTWEEIRKELPETIKRIDEGWTRWFDLYQYFDDEKNFGLVLGYDVEGELAMKLAYEPNDSYVHEYDMDWRFPVIKDDGTCWDTEMRISKEDADRPEFIKETVDWFQDQWLAMVAYYSKESQ